jgi:RimJ/RimL family protein N-acetyltransferase
LRRWQTGDRDSLARFANNRNIWINLRDRFPHPYTETDAERWIRESLAEVTPTRFAIVVDDQAIGGIGLELNNDVFARSAEIGYWVGEPSWGWGIATDAVRAFTAYGFSAFDLCRFTPA